MEIEDIEALLALVEKAHITEFDYSSAEGDRLYINKHARTAPATVPQSTPSLTSEASGAIAASSPPDIKNSTSEGNYIIAPLVGTFYAANAPDADAFVKLGQSIRKGEVVCIIEAMKIMNQVRADVEGVVVEVLIKDGQPVEYGQQLFRVDQRLLGVE